MDPSVVVHLRWAKGGHAELVTIADDAVEIRSTTSAPPGARLDAILEDGGSPTPVKVKSHGTHREADGSFTLKGRVLDANRELRDRLAALALGRRAR